jgi:hypothetical protein
MESMPQTDKSIYRIFFNSQGKTYEIYARKVEQGNLAGFIEVEELVFGKKSDIVVDPSEDALKKEFGGVTRLHLPFHSIVRIDEVEKEGAGKVLSIAGSDQPMSEPQPAQPPNPENKPE